MRLDRRLMALTSFGFLGLAACSHKGEAPEPTKRVVRCAAARATTITDAIELRGTVSPLPDRDAQIAAQVVGRVLQVSVREGDAVTVGQPIARIDSAALVDEAHAAEAAVARTRAELKNAVATSTRVQRVFEHGIAARQEVDDATARADSATAAENEAESAARRAQRQVERAIVRSPLKGVVVRIFRRPGELVDGTPATPIVEVADPGRLELDADATASDLVLLRKGQQADLTVGALPSVTWTGTVSAVSPAVDRATGLGVVRIELGLADGPRPPIGVLGTARVKTGAPRQTVVVPKEAARSGVGAEMEIVLCGADGLAHVRRFPRRAALSDSVETVGLSVGQTVVVEPVLGIADGEPLELAK